ncbi:MAG: hypothetical protein ACRDBL_10175 [Rhabdaerophilum sp.]
MNDDRPRRARFSLSGLSLPLISLLIASLSLMASISQSYNYRRNIESVQQNVLRAENLKTCREIIEVFFAFRLRAEEANARGAEMAADMQAGTRRELKSLVYRFGAIGTHLANFAPDAARERYSRLSWMLNDMAEKAMHVSANEFETRFTEIDKAFATLNEDCVKATKLHS